jgi:hypothetical protein
MAKLVGIFGFSGDGKTTSTIIAPDGSFNVGDKYDGLSPDSHIIINCDLKELPFPGNMWSFEKKNYIATAEFDKIKVVMQAAAKDQKIKTISVDTLNSYLTFKEYNERKRMSFDQWKDLALDIVELTVIANSVLRQDQVVFFFGHIELITDVNGDERKVLATTGKKLKKIFPESLMPIVLFTRVEAGEKGDNKYYFETRANKSSAKTPLGMFEEFLIPNSLKLVDNKIREYYKID